MPIAEKATQPRMTVEEFLAWDGGGHVGKLEVFRKGDAGGWSPDPEVATSGSVRLASIGSDLLISEVYRGTYLLPE